MPEAVPPGPVTEKVVPLMEVGFISCENVAVAEAAEPVVEITVGGFGISRTPAISGLSVTATPFRRTARPVTRTFGTVTL